MSGPLRLANTDLGIVRAVGALGLLGAAVGIMSGVLRNGGLGMLSVLGTLGILGGAFIALIYVIIKCPKPWILFCVRCMLPAEEGRGWWDFTVSCINEAKDSGERRQCILGFLWRAPVHFITSWKFHLNGSLRRARR